MTYSMFLGTIAVSQPSSVALFPGFGVKKVIYFIDNPLWILQTLPIIYCEFIIFHFIHVKNLEIDLFFFFPIVGIFILQ